MANIKDIAAFRAKFSAFADLDDTPIAAVLNTADVYLDPAKWSGRDFATARMYWAAHMLSLQQQNLANSTIDGTGLSDLYVKSIRFGERLVTFQQRQSFEQAEAGMGPGEIMLTATPYGQFYLQLRSRNIITVAII